MQHVAINVKSALIIIAFLIYGCQNQEKDINSNEKIIDSVIITETLDSSKILAINLKKSLPAFDLRLDSAIINVDLFSEHIQLDTSVCRSFMYDRMYFGKIDKIRSIVKTNGTSEVLFLQSGNLKMWPCRLSPKIKNGDTLFISGFVYDIFGNEKTNGLPTVLSDIYKKPGK